ncbi:hypothetical protein ACFXHA_12785 [Nocardia sp. NPDC059240]|uniref:hypothetical protein n=1 Tax=Nocardia sp. NPDC059240 TaxID=3346786 RepID=UPI00369BB42C
MTAPYYLAACCAATVAVAVRLPGWRRDPGTRPMTSAMAGFAIFAILRIRGVLDFIGDTAPGHNLGALASELVAIATSRLLCVHVAGQAWGRRDLVPWIGAAAAIAALGVVGSFAASDAPTTPTRLIGDLGGWAQAYATIGGSVTVIANGTVLGTVLYAARHGWAGFARTDRIALSLLGVAAVFGIIWGANRIVRIWVPAVYGFSSRVTLSLGVATVFAYSAYAILNYWLTARRDRRVRRQQEGAQYGWQES